MKENLTYSYNNELFAPIDRYFSGYIQEISKNSEPEVQLAAALVSRSTRNGSVCLDINSITYESIVEGVKTNQSFVVPEIDGWIDNLVNCSAVGKPGEYKPLILDSKNRLYFYRYWEYEKNIVDAINARIHSCIDDINYEKLREGVNRMFSMVDSREVDTQKLASITAVMNRFCVISGGPGTGKTTTIVKILALLIEQAGDYGIRIILCTPTGKAAASLSETIRSAKSELNCDDVVKNAMPEDTYTIHRLLKSISSSPYFRHNRNNPLEADVVVIDEASMVDLALMAKLFNSIPVDSRIILVGDKDQLSSVEAGSVLGDICNREMIQGISKDMAESLMTFVNEGTLDSSVILEYEKHMRGHIIVLDKNYRFHADSGIGGLSLAINNGDKEVGFRMLMDPNNKGIGLQEIYEHETLFNALKEKVINGYSPYLTADNPHQAVNLFNRLKILCALRTGPFGVHAINQIVERILHEHGLIRIDAREPDAMYKGRPILITRNDYSLGLFNGDTGIILPVENAGNSELYAAFPDKKDEIRYVPIHRLPEHETVYAMTIHKSQGSEFTDVLIILPDRYYPILTRELIYTGITRAINSVTIWGKMDVLKETIAHKIERASGLKDSLWGNLLE